MKKENITYSSAMERLEAIVNEIENGNLDIDLILDKIKEAQKLAAFCKNKLYKTENEVNKILDKPIQ